MQSELLPALITPGIAPAIADVDDLVKSFLDEMMPSTKAGYSKDLRTFADWLNARQPDTPARPTGLMIDLFLRLSNPEANALVGAWRSDQLARGLASATIGRRIAALKSLARFARVKTGSTLMIEVRAPKPEPARDMSGPDDAERRRLFRHLGKPTAQPRELRDRAIVWLIFGLGLRRKEVVGLDLVDVRYSESKILVLRKGKRQKAARHLPANTRRALGDWLLARGSQDGPLFFRMDRQRSTERLTGEAVRRLCLRIGQAAKLSRPLRPHGGRHAGITLLLGSGETEGAVAIFADHQNPQTTARYNDAKKTTGERLADKLDAALGASGCGKSH